MFLFASATDTRPYKIRFEHRPDYLYVMVSAKTTSYAIAKRYWTEILAMQGRRKYSHVILDKEVGGSLQPYDVLTLVSELVRSGVHDVWFAIVDRNYDEERCGFEEMAGTNRGLKVKMCRTVEEGESWLRMMSFAEHPRGPICVVT